MPGEDLFYFLEQARDGHSLHSHSSHSLVSPSTVAGGDSSADLTHSSSIGISFGGDGKVRVNEMEDGDDESGMGKMVNTPPTPSLLSSVRPSVIFSHARLKLVASMFKQMCDAVQASLSFLLFHI